MHLRFYILFIKEVSPECIISYTHKTWAYSSTEVINCPCQGTILPVNDRQVCESKEKPMIHNLLFPDTTYYNTGTIWKHQCHLPTCLLVCAVFFIDRVGLKIQKLVQSEFSCHCIVILCMDITIINMQTCDIRQLCIVLRLCPSSKKLCTHMQTFLVLTPN